MFEVGRAAGIPVRESVLKDGDLFGADEAFLTGTTREIMPIVKVDDRDIGSGLPGPVTKTLHETFRQMARGVMQPS
jgi:branched-subunit amino acid aminotransferase/4-amino-4-deoxychorismate lyase